MSSNSKETASLVLKTSDITTDDITTVTLATVINNSVGSIDISGQLIKWKNINPKMLLGDMYEKYDKFNLNLACYSSRKVGVQLVDSDITFYISGLQWSNQGYSLKTASITPKATLFSLQLVNTTTIGTDSFGQNMNTLTFYKPTSNFDITIEMKNSVDSYMAQIMSHQTFILDIVGCDGYQRNPITNYQEIPVNNIDNRLQLNSFR
jgi:hypothetical protein